MRSSLLISPLLLLPFVLADICPMEHHQVCNRGRYTCTCAVTTEETSAPEKSCNKVAEPDDDGNFPGVSVVLNLGEEKGDNDDDWPQAKFVDSLATILRIQKDTILILRVGCEGTEDKLTVQFAVLKKANGNVTFPLTKTDFVDAENMATRLKSMGHVNKIAGIDVDKIEFVDQLIDIEYDPDNSLLIIEAIASAVVFGLFLIIGCCTLNRKKEYEDDLQKP